MLEKVAFFKDWFFKPSGENISEPVLVLLLTVLELQTQSLSLWVLFPQLLQI